MKEDVEEHSVREGDMLLAKEYVAYPYRWFVLERLPNGDFKYLWSDNAKNIVIIGKGTGWKKKTWNLIR